ncbi:larval cuticle protein 2 [Drosophila kikkawai]|uniref:Larval cuticle protein 2 n=1 Tax=Drosophila kikkawai TaxID=30033 RepID=A0A6P4HMS2_DROKI|nr:larval cuticle protein 2 [Drosophila kikkawai]
MFKFVMILAVVGVAMAVAPVSRSEDHHAEVVHRSEDVRADGFDSDLQTTNGIQQAASGDVHGNIHGSFGWISPEGEHVDIKYVADENGYQPSGAWIPTPPPIPEAIVRALAWLQAHPQAPEHPRHH